MLSEGTERNPRRGTKPKTPNPTEIEDDELCICGHNFKEHQKINLKEVDSDLGIIYVCPDNISGLMPSVFIKPCCKETRDQERHRLLTILSDYKGELEGEIKVYEVRLCDLFQVACNTKLTEGKIKERRLKISAISEMEKRMKEANKK